MERLPLPDRGLSGLIDPALVMSITDSSLQEEEAAAALRRSASRTNSKSTFHLAPPSGSLSGTESEPATPKVTDFQQQLGPMSSFERGAAVEAVQACLRKNSRGALQPTNNALE